MSSRGRFALLIFLAAALFFAGLGSAGIRRAPEARVAEVAREMLDSGEWLVPELNAQVRLQKPPLLYWTVAGAYMLRGRVDEATARIPTALCAIAAVLLAATLAGRLFGPRAGFLAGAFLATTRVFLQEGRRAEADVPMTLFVILAMLAFDRGFREGRAMGKALFFGAMGFAFMTKGVPGVAIPLGAAAGWLAWEGRAREAIRPPFLAGLLLTLGIIAPWYALVWWTHPDATSVFYAETLRRMTPEAPHAEPFYYYLYRLPVDLLPWILLLLLPTTWSALRADPATRRAARLPIAWAGAGLFFLTALRAKQPHYLVPVAPAFAILGAAGIDRVLDGLRRRSLTPRAVYLALALVVAAEIFFVVRIEPRRFARKSPREACGQVARIVGNAPLLFYKFENSPCVFYLRRTAPVITDEARLEAALRRHPGAYVLTEVKEAGAHPLMSLPVAYRSDSYKRELVLRGPSGTQ